MRIKRREFLERSAIGVGGILFGPRLAPAAETKSKRCDPYETVALGKTGLKMSRTCMGTGMRGGQRQSNQTRMGKEKFEGLIRDAYERGVRVFDLADLYGTHPYVIPALNKIPRQNFSIVTKIWWRSGGLPEKERPDADVVVERFIKELKTDYIDLVLLHCVESPTWPKDLSQQMEILAKLKKKGLIRAHGVSCHTLAALEAVIAEPWVDSVHTRINPYGTKMDGPPDKVVPVLKKIHSAGKGVVGMKLIGEGAFRNSDEQRDKSVNFVVGLGCVDVLNVGFEKTEEIDDFAQRVQKVSLA